MKIYILFYASYGWKNNCYQNFVSLRSLRKAKHVKREIFVLKHGLFTIRHRGKRMVILYLTELWYVRMHNVDELVLAFYICL